MYSMLQFYLSLGLGAAGISEFPDDSVSENNKRKPWRNGEAKVLISIKRHFDS